jgi:hypothetical protein
MVCEDWWSRGAEPGAKRGGRSRGGRYSADSVVELGSLRMTLRGWQKKRYPAGDQKRGGRGKNSFSGVKLLGRVIYENFWRRVNSPGVHQFAPFAGGGVKIVFTA